MMEKKLTFSDLCIWVSFKFDDGSSFLFNRLNQNSSPILELSQAKKIMVIGMALPTYDLPAFLFKLSYLKKVNGTCFCFVKDTYSPFIQQNHSIFYGIKSNLIDDVCMHNLLPFQEDFPYGVASFLDPVSTSLGFIMSMRYQKLLPYLQNFFEEDLPLYFYIHGKNIYLYHINNR